MTENQVSVAMERFGKLIPSKEKEAFKQELIIANEGCMDGLMNVHMKSKWVAFVLAFFLGGIGAGRFYLGDTKIAILRIVATVLTAALSFVPILSWIVAAVSVIWVIAEWFLCFIKAKEINYESLNYYLTATARR